MEKTIITRIELTEAEVISLKKVLGIQSQCSYLEMGLSISQAFDMSELYGILPDLDNED